MIVLASDEEHRADYGMPAEACASDWLGQCGGVGCAEQPAKCTPGVRLQQQRRAAGSSPDARVQS